MLISPEKLNARQKRNLSYRLKTRSSQIDQVIQELELLIDNVPEESIKEILSNKTFDSLMNILEKFLQIRDPWPIGVYEDNNSLMAFRVFGNAIKSSDPGKCAVYSISYTTTYNEAELDKRLTDHYDRIRYYIDPCIPDPNCYTPDDIGKIENKVLKTVTKSGEPYVINHNAYIDETGVNENLWVTRKHSMIDINQLQWMRWKPKGLKECMEQPPILKEKKLNTQWGKGLSINGSSTPEEIKEFIEMLQKQNERPKLTEKELLEINKKLNSE